MTDYPLRWRVHFEFAAPGWFSDRARTARLLDAFASSAWLPELEVFGIGRKPGVRFASLDEVRGIVVSGMPGHYAFVRGDGDAAARPEGAEVALTFELLPRTLFVKGNARGAALGRLGARALDDFVGAVVALDEAWRDVARLAVAVATPGGELAYPRVRPVRRALGALASVAEVFDPDPVERAAPQDAALARAMARASPPPGVERTAAGRLIVQRWVRDPSDPAATADACSRHEAWAISLLGLPLAPGWTAAGAQQLGPLALDPRAAPLDLYDATHRLGLQRVGAAGDARWAAAAAALAGRRLDDGRELADVALIAPDAGAASRLHDAAVRAGFARVVYPDASAPDVFWDPDPPGSWVLVPA